MTYFDDLKVELLRTHTINDTEGSALCRGFLAIMHIAIIKGKELLWWNGVTFWYHNDSTCQFCYKGYTYVKPYKRKMTGGWHKLLLKHEILKKLVTFINEIDSLIITSTDRL